MQSVYAFPSWCFSPFSPLLKAFFLHLWGEELLIQDTVEGASACKAEFVEIGWIPLRKNPHVWHGQVLPPTICYTIVSSYACGAWQLLFTFMDLVWITMCQVQQELSRFLIAGDFLYQIRQVSVGCGESSPQENNRPMIPEESSSLCFCFSLLTYEESKIWRKIIVIHKLCPINVCYGVLQTLQAFQDC